MRIFLIVIFFYSISYSQSDTIRVKNAELLIVVAKDKVYTFELGGELELTKNGYAIEFKWDGNKAMDSLVAVIKEKDILIKKLSELKTIRTR